MYSMVKMNSPKTIEFIWEIEKSDHLQLFYPGECNYNNMVSFDANFVFNRFEKVPIRRRVS